MRRRLWILLLGLLCLAGAWFLWPRPVKLPTRPSASAPVPVPPGHTVRSASTAPNFLVTTSTNVPAGTNRFAWRLSNTPKSLDQLTHDRQGILLENALIDTGNPLKLSLPKNLQSHGDPGAYIVQARGPIGKAFRALLASAGAQIVSYIPNDAYLVRLNRGGAGGLAANALVQAVIPYEPYYKVQSSLMQWVGRPLPAGATLNLGLFPGEEQSGLKQIKSAGGQVISQNGDIVRVLPGGDWTALAQLPAVHIVEPYHERSHANDISRAELGVTTDTLVSSNYLGLTGKNVIVEVNDSGIDTNHPDFKGGGGPLRVFGDPANLVDTDGHGTHVAGIIAGDGTESTTVTNAEGSIIATPGGLGGVFTATNGQFRGKAPAATLLSMSYFDADQTLQEAAALTNALISNNSWNYGSARYDLAAASYDAAVRDALPEVTGSQPVLFVFSAGNSGGGGDSGSGGNPDTILSPATAKNVITVGALEELRTITNIVTLRSSNNVAVWRPETDTSYEVARFSSRGNVGIGTEGQFGRYKPDVVAPGTFVISTRSSEWDEQAYYNPTNYDFTFLTNQVVGANGVTYYSIFVPENSVSVSIQVVPEANSTFPFPTNLPIYVSLSQFPIPTNAATYDFVTWSNEVAIPPNSGGGVVDITSVQGLGFNYAVGNTNATAVNYGVFIEIITTNDLGNYFQVLSNLNNSLDGDPDSTIPPHYYRYESGTSMSAADVSGVLALMQDYFTNTLGAVPSPALLKALLINGARPTGFYDFGVKNAVNYEGWGLANLPNSLPSCQTTNMSVASDSFFVDQTPTNGLASGDSRTYLVKLDSTTDAQFLPLRVTLTWTDPPGDPAAAIKLVNSLELVVTNLDDPTNAIYYGNNIIGGNIYNSTANASNPPPFDVINNVQNVFIPPLLGTNYSITVIGREVNVNAVTAQTNDVNGNYAPNVVQDFALVISCGEGEVTNAFTVTPGVPSAVGSNPTGDQQVTYVANANAPLLDQFVGASTPLLGTNQQPFVGLSTNYQWSGTNGVVTLGMTNQWHFYVVTNTFAADFTNAAFVTFLPPTLSLPRMGAFAGFTPNATRPEADIDMYVAGPGDPNAALLTNLDTTVLSNCIFGVNGDAVSLGRGGTEFVAYSNSVPGNVYYVGIYSEDQEASEYTFIPVFSNIPFSQPGPNGSEIVNGVPVPIQIPDGNPALPGTTNLMCLALFPMQVQRVVVTNIIEQQNVGDLVVSLFHSQNGAGVNASPVILMNHNSPNAPGQYTLVYDDSGQGDIPSAQPSSGPGNLNGFVGQEGIGPWILTVSDSSSGFIGSVQGAQLFVQPHQDLSKGITGSLEGHTWFYDFIDVPAGTTNLTLVATNTTVPPGLLPISMVVKLGSRPNGTNFDELVLLTNSPTPPLLPGNSISIGPPLTPGRYWVGLFNPNVATQTFFLQAFLHAGVSPLQSVFTSSGPVPILDDAVTTASMFVNRDQALSTVEVGLRVDHPRVSDLVFHLISPDGTRCLLVENRGGDTANMGVSLAQTNLTTVQAAGGAAPATNIVNVAQTNGILTINYNFYAAPDEMWVFDQGGNQIFDSGLISGSGVFNIPYTNSTQLTIVMNLNGNSVSSTKWDYTVASLQADTKYLVLTEDKTKTTTPIKFAPVPFVPFVLSSNSIAPQTNIVVMTNFTTFSWHSSFESTQGNVGPTAGQVFSEGWHVDSGDVDLLTNGIFGSMSDEGTYYIDLNGSGPGTISTNIPGLTPGQNYVLHITYTANPFIGFTPSANVNINGSTVATLSPNWANSAADLNWQTTSFVFTATSPTVLQLQSLTPGLGGVYFDELDMTSGLTNGFENTYAGDYVLGTNAGFGGWTVTANQVSVVTDTNTAYTGSNCLALANGTISRILPTLPGSNYFLTFAYRGPNASALWRAEGNENDSVSTNNGSVSLGAVTFVPGEVRQGFSFDGGVNAIVMPDSASVDPGANEDFSIDGWISPLMPPPAVTTGVMSFVDHRITTNLAGFQGYEFCLVNGNVSFSLSDTYSAGAGATTSGLELRDGNFHHLAASVKRNSTTGAKVYVDGAQVLQFNPTSKSGALTPTPPQPFRIGNHAGTYGYYSYFHGRIDEVTFYKRALSESEIRAFYTKGVAGKYNTNAPSLSQGLAEAQVTLNGSALPVLYGSNTNWQTTNILFTATQTNTVLQVAGIEPGMLLDGFVLAPATNLVTSTTNAVYLANDLFYLPEETLAKYQGESASGQWQLEIQDDRAGAGLTNSLVSWQLRFNFATNLSSIGTLTNGQGVTNLIPAGGMAWYLVIVPPYADMATNRLISATGPLNMWFNQTTPPVGTNPPDFLLIPNSTGPASSILTLTSNPTNFVSPGTYYLGIQNPGASSVTYGIEVDFHLLNPVILPIVGTQFVNESNLMTVVDTATGGTAPITYTLNMSVDTAAMIVNGWPLTYATTIPSPVISPTGIITWTPTELQGPGFYTVQTIATDSSLPPFSATNTFSVIVEEVNLPPSFLTNPPPQTVDELTTLTVTNAASDVDIPPNPLTYTVSIVVDTNAMTLNGWPLNYATGIPSPVIDTNGVITWTPSEAQGPGVYDIISVVTDTNIYALANRSLSATNSFQVTVNEVNTPPFFLFTPADQTVNPFVTLTVANTAGDFDLPPNPLTYTLINPPAGMSIDTNGIITWTPGLAEALTTNVITTVVTDTNIYALVNRSLSITNTFTIIVLGVTDPFAFTEPATSITGTDAQLNGMATPDGPPTTAWFEWGTSAVYGNQTPPVNVGGSYGVVYVTSQLNGLVMNQPYHYRLVVSNVVGVVYGFDQIFDATTVTAWGGDYINQTDVPPGLSNVVAVAAAYDHSLAVKNDGTVVAWGDNTKNQTNVPAGLNGVVAVAGGQYYSLALKNDQTVVPWGGNLLGQTNVPAGLNGVATIAGGTFASLTLRTNGQVVSWGANFFGLTNVPPFVTNIVAVAGGGYHSLALKNNGTVFVWGNNSTGQTNVPPGLTNVVAIAAGSYHSLALRANGTVVAWGDDSANQTNVPPGLSNVVAVAAGGFHSLVLKNDGSVLAWGDDTDGQTNIPAGLSNVVAVASGYFHNLALASAFNVNLTNTPPFFLATPPPKTLNELTTLTVTNAAGDSDLPAQTLTYTASVVVDTNAMTLNGWPLNYATGSPAPVIGANGVITWIPGEAQGPGVYNLISVVTDNGAPPLSATNSFKVTVNEVNTAPFFPSTPPDQTANVGSPITIANPAADADLPPNPLTYTLSSAPTNMVIDINGVITWTPAPAQLWSNYTVVTVVRDTNAYALANKSLSATNQFNITVGPPLLGNGVPPQTNTLAPGGVAYYQVNVPVNADFATNLLLFATGGPLNVWFSTNLPPTVGNTNDFQLITNATSGAAVLSAGSTPPLVPGSTYYLGVQNSGGSPVNYGITVNFHVTPFITGVSITATNLSSINGFWVQWSGPTNWLYSIEWTTNLDPAFAWNTILNPVVTMVVTPPDGLFGFFDDGSLTGGSAAMKFYRILAGTNASPAAGILPAGALAQAVVSVPAPAAWASNVLVSASGPVNVFFNPNNPPSGNTNTGDFLMLSVTNSGVFLLTTNTVPLLVPGTNYYLAFQNPGGTGVTYTFQVSFGSTVASLAAVSITNLTVLNNGNCQLQWTAPVSYQFQVQWTTNLVPPVTWNTITNYATGIYLTSTNGTFGFGDTNAPMAMKFYRLLEYP